MDEAKAREILGDWIQSDNILYLRSQFKTIQWDGEYIIIDGFFLPDELEAIAWLMRNKKVKEPEPIPEKPKCTHEKCKPPFDEEKAKTMSPEQIREAYPRFEGYCSECGAKVVQYASFKHYVMGWES